MKKGKIIPLSALLDLITLSGSEGCKEGLVLSWQQPTKSVELLVSGEPTMACDRLK